MQKQYFGRIKLQGGKVVEKDIRIHVSNGSDKGFERLLRDICGLQ